MKTLWFGIVWKKTTCTTEGPFYKPKYQSHNPGDGLPCGAKTRELKQFKNQHAECFSAASGWKEAGFPFMRLPDLSSFDTFWLDNLVRRDSISLGPSWSKREDVIKPKDPISHTRRKTKEINRYINTWPMYKDCRYNLFTRFCKFVLHGNIFRNTQVLHFINIWSQSNCSEWCSCLKICNLK